MFVYSWKQFCPSKYDWRLIWILPRSKNEWCSQSRDVETQENNVKPVLFVFFSSLCQLNVAWRPVAMTTAPEKPTRNSHTDYAEIPTFRALISYSFMFAEFSGLMFILRSLRSDCLNTRGGSLANLNSCSTDNLSTFRSTYFCANWTETQNCAARVATCYVCQSQATAELTYSPLFYIDSFFIKTYYWPVKSDSFGPCYLALVAF